MKKIAKDIEIKDNSLFLKNTKTLIIADLHLGIEETILNQGISLPKQNLTNIQTRINKLIKKFSPKQIIINGDIKHEHGKILISEWEETLKIIRNIQKQTKLRIIKGNHDNLIKPILKKIGIKLEEEIKIGKTLITHGHKTPKEKEYERIIIGHVHPATTIKDGIRTEKYKCFLKGTYKKKEIIIMPSFHEITIGTKIATINAENQEKTNIIKEKKEFGPITKEIKNTEIYITDKDNEYYFGK